jgi:REP element-mobilizing transposase RayT
MPRKARIDATGAIHHIMVRGIEGRKVFRTDADRKNFLDRLSALVPDSQTRCFAWALLPNHVHLLLQTGLMPIATLMQRLLTGYAVSFNLKYQRHGQLFQNRYKSILCQEDPYLKELVRYIHLNPLRAGLVPDIKALDSYPWSGHSVIMGKVQQDWQDKNYVLAFFGGTISKGRRHYRSFVEAGISNGRRPDLIGGGLIRSLGGWEGVKALRKMNIRFKGDERILGDSDFVEQVLKEANERFERRYDLRAKGYDFDGVVKRVSEIMRLEPSDVLRPRRVPQTVKARSLLCYWANKELGMTTTEISRRLKISQSGVCKASLRGERLALENGYRL